MRFSSSSGRSYTIAQIAAITEYIDTAIAEAVSAGIIESKEYTDAEVVTLNESIAAEVLTLNNAIDALALILAAKGTCSIITGTYTGDGGDDRSINIGVDLATKSNVYVIVKAETAFYAVHRTEYAQGANSMCYNNTADISIGIYAFNATGFTVSYSNYSNGSGIIYRYIVFWTD